MATADLNAEIANLERQCDKCNAILELTGRSSMALWVRPGIARINQHYGIISITLPDRIERICLENREETLQYNIR